MKTQNYLNGLKLFVLNQKCKKKVNLSLAFGNRFWTFINVHFAKGPDLPGKKREKVTCDHNALISVFSRKML